VQHDFIVWRPQGSCAFYWLFGWPTLWFRYSDRRAWIRDGSSAWDLDRARVAANCAGACVYPLRSHRLSRLIWMAGIPKREPRRGVADCGIEAKYPGIRFGPVGNCGISCVEMGMRLWLLLVSARRSRFDGGLGVVAAAIAFVFIERLGNRTVQLSAVFTLEVVFSACDSRCWDLSLPPSRCHREPPGGRGHFGRPGLRVFPDLPSPAALGVSL